MSKIFGDDSDGEINFTTNNEFAKNYNIWRKKEELNKLKTKYGDDVDLDGESSSSSEDDEDGVELTEEVEKEFFKTLSYLKNKDPRIYDENVKFFENTQTTSSKNVKKKKEKPLFIKDYERKLLLEKNGRFSDSEEEIDDSRAKSPTYVQEQQQIKDSFKKILDENDEDDGVDEWGGVLKARQKTEEEKQQEEADYKEWLAGQREKLDDKEAETDLKPLKDYWSNPKLDNSEKFLRDYILNKKFLSKEDEDYIPTYEEIVHDSDKDLSEDEEAIEKQEEFEHKYNFRFEEPDQDFIKRYPRTIEQSLRKTDDKRKLKRAETKERKQREKEEKMKDLKKLQELKRKEIEEKIEKLKEITGNTDVGFQEEDLDGDFDPEAHDRRMQSLFNDEFYEGNEEEQKPEFPELDQYLEIENWEKWQGEKEEDGLEGNEPHCEDDDFNMDCDYNPGPSTSIADEMIENSKGKKKRKRKSLFAKTLNLPKPVFDPNDKTFEEYLDEYYKFDCEDIIGDIPCRFKYRKVVPNSFGLTIEEILSANDRELNKWCSLKKAIQHRPDNVEKYDQIAFERKARNLELKKRILPSLFKSEENTQDGNSGVVENCNNDENKQILTKKGKKKNKQKLEGDKNEVMEGNSDNNNDSVEKTKRNKRKLSERDATFNKDEPSLLEMKQDRNSTDSKSEVNNENNKGSVTKSKKNKKKSSKSSENEPSLIKTAGESNNTIDKSEVMEKNNNNAPTKKAKKKKKKQVATETNTENNKLATSKKRKRNNSDVNSEVPSKKSKKKNQNKSKTDSLGISDARLSAYGLNPKKFKNKLKYSNK